MLLSSSEGGEKLGEKLNISCLIGEEGCDPNPTGETSWEELSSIRSGMAKLASLCALISKSEEFSSTCEKNNMT